MLKLIQLWSVIIVLQLQVSGQNMEYNGVFSGAGGISKSGGITMTGVLGEPFEGATSFTGQYSLSGGFITTLDLDIDAPAIIHTIIASASENQPLTVEATITDDTGVRAVILYSRKGGESNFTEREMVHAGDDLYRATIPANDMTSWGIEYYITATDVVNRLTRHPETGFISVSLICANVASSSAQVSGSEATAYRLVSLPFNANNKNPVVIWEDVLGPYDVTKWRFFELRTDQSYAEFPGTSPMAPGRAFWLIVADPGKTLVTGQGTSVRTDQPFEIPLNRGWTFISTPFNFTIPLGNLSMSNDSTVDLRSFNGSWSSHTGNLQPFAGYASFSDEATTLLINPDMSTGPTPHIVEGSVSVSDDNKSWGIQITGESGYARDIDNWALITTNASREWDRYDRPNPPVIGEYVDIYFHRPEWERTAIKFSTDARPVPLDGESWDFQVCSNRKDVITLRFENIETVPGEYQIRLFDERLNTLQDLRANNIFQYANHGEQHPKEFVLFIGTVDYLYEQIDVSRLVPDSYVLSQNFPNPFNPVTSIRIGLPVDDFVSLTIYDIMGRVIINLIENQPVRAGYHVVTWDAKDRSGAGVSSGTYLYQLRTGSYTKTMKLILLR